MNIFSIQCAALKVISKVMDDLDDETIKDTILPKVRIVFTKESDTQVKCVSKMHMRVRLIHHVVVVVLVLVVMHFVYLFPFWSFCVHHRIDICIEQFTDARKCSRVYHTSAQSLGQK